MARAYAEIERKWLLKSLPGPEIFKVLPVRRLHYQTLYLLTGDPELRFRRVTKNGKVSYQGTYKAGGILKRVEVHLPPPSASLFSFNLKKGCPCLKKDRFKVKMPDGDVWEFDDFSGSLKGLFLVELEIKRRAQGIIVPSWLSRLIVVEVTDKLEFYNKNLAVFGAAKIAPTLRMHGIKLGND